MNIFAVELFDDTGSECVFYTVRMVGSDVSETDKFFLKFENHPTLGEPLTELAKFLQVVIGEEYGARKYFFRFENEAQGLPPPGKHNVGEICINYSGFPLRLYCLRITDHLIVLFNGDEKTSSTAQGGKTSMTFHDANQFAKRITEALSDKTIIVSDDQRFLLDNNNTDEIIL